MIPPEGHRVVAVMRWIIKKYNELQNRFWSVKSFYSSNIHSLQKLSFYVGTDDNREPVACVRYPFPVTAFTPTMFEKATYVGEGYAQGIRYLWYTYPPVFLIYFTVMCIFSLLSTCDIARNYRFYFILTCGVAFKRLLTAKDLDFVWYYYHTVLELFCMNVFKNRHGVSDLEWDTQQGAVHIVQRSPYVNISV